MLKVILGIFIEKLIEAVSDLIRDFLKTQKIKKESKEKVKDALSEKDPVVRAKRITDLLNTD